MLNTPNDQNSIAQEKIDQPMDLNSHYFFQGKCFCLLQLFRLSNEKFQKNKFSIDPMLPFVEVSFNICFDTLQSLVYSFLYKLIIFFQDNNVVVSSLELLQELLTGYIEYLLEIWGLNSI